MSKVVGFDISEDCLCAAVLEDGKPVVIKPKKGIPSDFMSMEGGQTARDAFLMGMLKDAAESYLGEKVCDVIIAAHGERSLLRNQSYCDAARMAGLYCKRIVSDSVLASLLSSYNQSEKVAVVCVSKVGVGVCVSDVGDGVYEIKSKRSALIENLLGDLSEIGTLYLNCLKASELTQVSKIYVCGNADYVTPVADFLRKGTGCETVIVEDPETVVARGAAIRGGILKSDVKDILLLDVTSAPLGYELSNGSMKVLIDQDSTIPVRHTFWTWPTGGAKGELDINVYEGVNKVASKNRFLGNVCATCGDGPWEVEFDLDANEYLMARLRRIGDCKMISKTLKDVGHERLLKGLPSDCEMCNGEGRVKCKECNGEGELKGCHICHGSGYQGKCDDCAGSGAVCCPDCAGAGVDYDYDPPIKCKTCGGTGKKSCSSCGGTGKKTCNNCNGKGRETCHTCKGDGLVPCSVCKKRQQEAVEKIRQSELKAVRDAAEKAEKEKRESAARIAAEKMRVQRKADLFRGFWWFLFRVAAAGVYFACLKDCYRDMSEDAVALLTAGFFVASYVVRSKFGGGTCYFLVGLALPIAVCVYNTTNPMVSFCLFTVMVTFFMRWMGEKLKFPLLTYPLVGAMVGFCTSPFAISHNVFNVTPWWFSVMGLSILFFFVNIGMSGNNGNGVVAKGERKTSWSWTFWILAVCALVSAYILASQNGEVYKFKWQKGEKKIEAATLDSVAGNEVEDRGGVKSEIDAAMALIADGKTDEAIRNLKAAAERGNADAYLSLGMVYEKLGKKDAAIETYQAAASQGVVDAMMLLVRYYSEKTGALGGCRDKDLAVKYCRMAAEKGDASAQIQMKELTR